MQIYDAQNTIITYVMYVTRICVYIKGLIKVHGNIVEYWKTIYEECCVPFGTPISRHSHMMTT